MVTGLYAMWVAKFIKVVEVVSKVDIMETSVGVVMVGEAISVGLFVGGSVGSDISVELAEDKVEGKGGKDATEGTTLREAFKLLEKGP